MKFKDSITQYFEELPNRWSANFLAFMGFNNILLAIIGNIISMLYAFVLQPKDLKLLLTLSIYIPIYAIAFLPISCIIALILLFPFRQLLKTNDLKVFKINSIILFLISSICYILLIPFFDFTSGGTIYIVFIPIILFWIPILIFILYLFLLWKENSRKLPIKNSILLENKYYKKCVKIFFIYGFVLFGIIELLLLLFGIIMFVFNV